VGSEKISFYLFQLFGKTNIRKLFFELFFWSKVDTSNKRKKYVHPLFFQHFPPKKQHIAT